MSIEELAKNLPGDGWSLLVEYADGVWDVTAMCESGDHMASAYEKDLPTALRKCELRMRTMLAELHHAAVARA